MRDIDRLLARVPFAPVVAAMFAVVAIVLVAATPQWLFERWVVASGLPNLISAAVPPLGEKARILAALFAGATTGALIYLGLTLGAKVVRRPSVASVGDEVSFRPPRAAPRRPLLAGNELGAPLMSDEAMAQAREELILDAPIEMETVEEQVVQDEPPVPVHVQPIDQHSITSLLGRLEAAIARRPADYRPGRTDLARLRAAMGR